MKAQGEMLRIIRWHDETDAHYAKRYYDEYFYSRARAKDCVLVAVTSKNKVIGVSGYFRDYYRKGEDQMILGKNISRR